MDAPEIDAWERVAGFSMPAIQRALVRVGLFDDRDDIKSVVDALKCSEAQAIKVLRALEQKHWVTKAKGPKQWDVTKEGKGIAFHWQAPRRIEDAVDYECERSLCNMVFLTVPCSIVRYGADVDTYEEADIEVGTWVEHDTDRLVGIGISQPDDYEARDEGGSRVVAEVRLGIDAAKRYVKGLQEAIERAEEEVALRAKDRSKKPKRTSAAKERKATAASVSAAARLAEKAAMKAKRTAAADQLRQKALLAKTMRELGRKG